MSETHIPTEQPASSQKARLSAPDVHQGRSGDHPGATPQGSPAPLGLIWRVDRRSTFALLRHGRRVRSGPLMVTRVELPPGTPPRAAFALSRKVGTAVTRNRLRRRLRALMREVAPTLGSTASLVAASPAAPALSYQELRAHLHQALGLEIVS